MSDTTGAAEGRLRASSPTIESVCRVLEARPEGAETLLLEFTRLFLSRAPEELLHARTPEGLADMVVGTFSFLRTTSAFRGADGGFVLLGALLVLGDRDGAGDVLISLSVRFRWRSYSRCSGSCRPARAKAGTSGTSSVDH